MAAEMSDPQDDLFKEAFSAIKMNNIDLIQRMIEEGILDLNQHSNQLFRLACHYARNQIVKMLLDSKKVNPGDLDNYSIEEASKQGNYELVNLLLVYLIM